MTSTQKQLEDQRPQLTVRQRLLLDGIRYSVLMTTYTIDRLRALLAALSDSRRPTASDYTNAFLDSWSIVDSCHRLRDLIRATPGIKQNEPNILLFLQRTRSVEDLRNYIQHTIGDIRTIEEMQKPFWGSLSWFRIYDQMHGRICLLRIGSSHQKEETLPLVNPGGRRVKPPVDLLTLNAIGYEISLTEVAEAVATVENSIREQLSARFSLASLTGTGELFASVDWEGHADRQTGC